MVSVWGEIDIHTVHDLSVLLLKAIAEAGQGGRVIVDLEAVEFMDCSGVRALMSGQSVLGDSSGSLAVVCWGHVRGLLEFLGLERSLDLYPDLHSAAADCMVES